MNTQNIRELIDIFSHSALSTMKLSEGDFSIELAREASTQAPVQSAPNVQMPKPEAEGKTINAPLVGTYYCAPSPEAEAFVVVGQSVKKGETICLIEAMKMMSEVPAPCDCVVEQLLQENGTLLAYDAPILRYRAV